nr:hypothetical protein [uncultured Flavobacterium sp.]
MYDPWADAHEVWKEYGVPILTELPSNLFDAVIVAVAHREFLQMDVKNLLNKQGMLFDLKASLDRSIVDARL